ncbi:MAG: DUF6868 family protein [Betaproteobacteria bacterium]|jgi:hypothetical protein
MSIDTLRGFLGWCAVINYGVLLGWFLVFVLAHDWMQRLHGRWFRLTVGQFDSIHYAAMAIFKLGILLLNVVPYVAIRIVA